MSNSSVGCGADGTEIDDAKVEAARTTYYQHRAAGCDHRDALYRAGFTLQSRDYNELARIVGY